MLIKPSSRGPASAYPPNPEGLPKESLEHGHYRMRFARNAQDLDEILRLRFRVFNLELGEGLERSRETGRDEDAFDRCCHHLLVEDTANGEVIGTYRMQTSAMAQAGEGFYSAGEFDLGALPGEVLQDAIEVGRGCVARAYRNRQVLFLLWKGLAAYVSLNQKRYLFGCSSLSSQDPKEGVGLLRYLESNGYLDPHLQVPPLPGLECSCDEEEADPLPVPAIPTLFKTYLRYGALVCSQPAIDRAFKTIDFFVLIDVESLTPRTYRLFFG